MNNQGNLFSQIEQIKSNLVAQAHNLAEPQLLSAMLPMLEQMYSELEGYTPLTGNTNNSLAIGLYLDGNVLGLVNVRNIDGVARPTRMTLKYGEVYDLPATWSGSRSFNRRKSDWVGDRNFWADEEALRFLRSNPPSFKGYSYKFVSAVDYAKYLEAKGRINILTRWHDELHSAGATVSALNS